MEQQRSQRTDFEPDDAKFNSLLIQATSNASGDFETGFVSSLKERHEKYGSRMNLTQKQWDILKRIAK